MAGVAAVASVITAAAATTGAVLNYQAQQDARGAQDALKADQATRLKAESDAAAAMAATQATTGSVFGREDTTHSVITGLGFSSGNGGPSTGFGRAQLVGESS